MCEQVAQTHRHPPLRPQRQPQRMPTGEWGLPVSKPGSWAGCSDSRGAGKCSEMEDVSGHPPAQEKMIRVRIQGDLGGGE